MHGRDQGASSRVSPNVVLVLPARRSRTGGLVSTLRVCDTSVAVSAAAVTRPLNSRHSASASPCQLAQAVSLTWSFYVRVLQKVVTKLPSTHALRPADRAGRRRSTHPRAVPAGDRAETPTCTAVVQRDSSRWINRPQAHYSAPPPRPPQPATLRPSSVRALTSCTCPR